MPTAAANDRTEYVSTGYLPPPEEVRRCLQGACQTFHCSTEGENAQVYPDFGRVLRDLVDCCVLGSKGAVLDVGETSYESAIMSVFKPFVCAQVYQRIDPGQAHRVSQSVSGLDSASKEEATNLYTRQ